LTLPLFYSIIILSVSNISNLNSTLAEVATDFLVSLPPHDREKAQEKVYKFIRWLGLHRKASNISPLDINRYSDQIMSPETKPVKSFLVYIHKKGYCKVNLAVHLRAKKPSHKITLPKQHSQIQTTLTSQGYNELEVELGKLKKQRSDVTEELRRAAADKDFRENAPLKAARENKSHLEGRIQKLESTLKSATIIAENRSTSRVKIGDSIELYDLSSDRQLCYILVDPREANSIKSKISTISPLGKALLGKEKGQTIEFTAPAGTFSYRIKEIRSLNHGKYTIR